MRDLPLYHRSVSAARRRLLGAMSVMVLVIVAALALPAAAAERIELEQRVLVGEEGSLQQLAEVTVSDDHVGVVCTLLVHTENQDSVHPGNDLVITTGDVQAVIEDVEAEADAGRDLSAEVVLGSTIVVELRFGPHRLSSMGYELDVDCGTTAPIIAGASTDTEPPPVSEVSVPSTTIPETCADATGGGEALTIDGDLCPLPTVLGETVENTTTTAAPTTVPTTPTTAAPTTTTTAAGTGASVLGETLERNLAQAPAATPVQANPAYAG